MKTFILTLLILLAFNQSFTQPGNVSPFDTTIYGRNEHAGRYIHIRGFNMYYEKYGSGKPLLMIHGNGGSINNFLYQIPYFSKNYTVIVPDSRAQGRSIDPNDSLSFEMMADDFNALLDSLHIDSCFVLGWSDGGINGLLLAIRHPDKVKKLAITGANLWPDSSAINPADFKWGVNFYDSLTNLPKTSELKSTLKLTRLDLFEPHITIKQLHKIQCPVLVIGGDRDIILPQHTLLIAQNISHAFLWILPDSGHATLIEHKDLFNHEVDHFFGNNSGK